MAGSNWAEKFKNKHQDKELASQEANKNFEIYKQAVLELFEHIERKVKNIDVITVVRTLLGHSGGTPGPIKALNLKCGGHFIRFAPEGINPDHSRGRIRIEHKCRTLAQFLYLHLLTDPNSEKIFPGNLIWVYNEDGKTDEEADFSILPHFDDELLEQLIENCFL